MTPADRIRQELGTEHTKATPCPSCGTVVDAATPVRGPNPEPGNPADQQLMADMDRRWQRTLKSGGAA